MRALFLTTSLILLITCCSSTPPVTPSVTKKTNLIENQERLFLQHQVAMLSTEVHDLQISTYGRSQKQPGGVWDRLRRCQLRLTDSRIGGSGSPTQIENWANVAGKRRKLTTASQETLRARLEEVLKTRHLLDEKYRSLERKHQDCETKFRAALVKHGLNPDDMKAKGRWTDGPEDIKVWSLKRRSTTDPKELIRRKKHQTN